VKCEFCGKKLSKNWLSVHIRKEYAEELNAECPFCGEKLVNILGLRGHVAKAHGRDALREMDKRRGAEKATIRALAEAY